MRKNCYWRWWIWESDNPQRTTLRDAPTCANLVSPAGARSPQGGFDLTREVRSSSGCHPWAAHQDTTVVQGIVATCREDTDALKLDGQSCAKFGLQMDNLPKEAKRAAGTRRISQAGRSKTRRHLQDWKPPGSRVGVCSIPARDCIEPNHMR